MAGACLGIRAGPGCLPKKVAPFPGETEAEMTGMGRYSVGARCGHLSCLFAAQALGTPSFTKQHTLHIMRLFPRSDPKTLPSQLPLRLDVTQAPPILLIRLVSENGVGHKADFMAQTWHLCWGEGDSGEVKVLTQKQTCGLVAASVATLLRPDPSFQMSFWNWSLILQDP